jgi:hypothetical protein
MFGFWANAEIPANWVNTSTIGLILFISLNRFDEFFSRQQLQLSKVVGKTANFGSARQTADFSTLNFEDKFYKIIYFSGIFTSIPEYNSDVQHNRYPGICYPKSLRIHSYRPAFYQQEAPSPVHLHFPVYCPVFSNCQYPSAQ